MRNPFRTKPKSFLDAARREWQFQCFAWLLRHCGGYPKFLETTLVLPIEEHFPDRGMSGHAAVAALFRRVRDHAGMADWPCMVEPDSDVARDSSASGRIRVFNYSPEEKHPEVLVAQFAHELGRYLVESFDEPPPGGAALYEPAIEFAAVFMGFGLFMVNSSVDAGRWQLNEGELAHALAMFCLLRKAPVELLDPHLNPHVRKHVRLAELDLARQDGGFQRLRSVFAVSPMDAADKTLPTA